MRARYFLKESITNLRRNKLMTTAAVSTVTISLTIFGFFLLTVINLNNLANNIGSKIEIVAYLKDNISEDKIVALSEQIFYLDGVKDVEFISKDEALLNLQQRLGTKIILEDIIVENPLPSSLVIKVNDEEKIKSVANRLKNYDEIKEVVYPQELLPTLLSISNLTRIIGAGIISLLAIGAIFLIMNAIKLTVFARRKEIRIMQLVGATDWFIRLPYLIEGLIQGFTGGVLAGIIVIIGYSYLTHLINGALPFINLVNDTLLLVNLSLIMIIFGMFLGIMGSLIAISKFLQEV